MANKKKKKGSKHITTGGVPGAPPPNNRRYYRRPLRLISEKEKNKIIEKDKKTKFMKIIGAEENYFKRLINRQTKEYKLYKKTFIDEKTEDEKIKNLGKMKKALNTNTHIDDKQLDFLSKYYLQNDFFLDEYDKHQNNEIAYNFFNIKNEHIIKYLIQQLINEFMSLILKISIINNKSNSIIAKVIEILNNKNEYLNDLNSKNYLNVIYLFLFLFYDLNILELLKKDNNNLNEELKNTFFFKKMIKKIIKKEYKQKDGQTDEEYNKEIDKLINDNLTKEINEQIVRDLDNIFKNDEKLLNTKYYYLLYNSQILNNTSYIFTNTILPVFILDLLSLSFKKIKQLQYTNTTQPPQAVAPVVPEITTNNPVVNEEILNKFEEIYKIYQQENYYKDNTDEAEKFYNIYENNKNFIKYLIYKLIEYTKEVFSKISNKNEFQIEIYNTLDRITNNGIQIFLTYDYNNITYLYLYLYITLKIHIRYNYVEIKENYIYYKNNKILDDIGSIDSFIIAYEKIINTFLNVQKYDYNSYNNQLKENNILINISNTFIVLNTVDKPIVLPSSDKETPHVPLNTNEIEIFNKFCNDEITKELKDKDKKLDKNGEQLFKIALYYLIKKQCDYFKDILNDDIIKGIEGILKDNNDLSQKYADRIIGFYIKPINEFIKYVTNTLTSELFKKKIINSDIKIAVNIYIFLYEDFKINNFINEFVKKGILKGKTYSKFFTLKNTNKEEPGNYYIHNINEKIQLDVFRETKKFFTEIFEKVKPLDKTFFKKLRWNYSIIKKENNIDVYDKDNETDNTIKGKLGIGLDLINTKISSLKTPFAYYNHFRLYFTDPYPTDKDKKKNRKFVKKDAKNDVNNDVKNYIKITLKKKIEELKICESHPTHIPPSQQIVISDPTDNKTRYIEDIDIRVIDINNGIGIFDKKTTNQLKALIMSKTYLLFILDFFNCKTKISSNINIYDNIISLITSKIKEIIGKNIKTNGGNNKKVLNNISTNFNSIINDNISDIKNEFNLNNKYIGGGGFGETPILQKLAIIYVQFIIIYLEKMFNIEFNDNYKKILECIYPEYGKDDEDLNISFIKGDETIFDIFYSNIGEEPKKEIPKIPKEEIPKETKEKTEKKPEETKKPEEKPKETEENHEETEEKPKKTEEIPKEKPKKPEENLIDSLKSKLPNALEVISVERTYKIGDLKRAIINANIITGEDIISKLPNTSITEEKIEKIKEEIKRETREKTKTGGNTITLVQKNVSGQNNDCYLYSLSNTIYSEYLVKIVYEKITLLPNIDQNSNFEKLLKDTIDIISKYNEDKTVEINTEDKIVLFRFLIYYYYVYDETYNPDVETYNPDGTKVPDNPPKTQYNRLKELINNYLEFVSAGIAEELYGKYISENINNFLINEKYFSDENDIKDNEKKRYSTKEDINTRINDNKLKKLAIKLGEIVFSDAMYSSEASYIIDLINRSDNEKTIFGLILLKINPYSVRGKITDEINKEIVMESLVNKIKNILDKGNTKQYYGIIFIPPNKPNHYNFMQCYINDDNNNITNIFSIELLKYIKDNKDEIKYKVDHTVSDTCNKYQMFPVSTIKTVSTNGNLVGGKIKKNTKRRK